jgi:hypothetical protein
MSPGDQIRFQRAWPISRFVETGAWPGVPNADLITGPHQRGSGFRGVRPARALSGHDGLSSHRNDERYTRGRSDRATATITTAVQLGQRMTSPGPLR